MLVEPCGESLGTLFPEDLTREIKSRFRYVDQDANGQARLYMENAGGSFRLAAAVERLGRVDEIPNCSERMDETARTLDAVVEKGTADFRIMLNAKGGAVFTSLTASEAMFDMVRAIAENISGSNVVTTALEHPSSFDAIAFYAQRLNKEMRVAKGDPATGGVDVDHIISLVDRDTNFLSVMYASNISGAIMDIREIAERARAIRPDLYIIVDAVQHAPHGLIDLQEIPVDAMNIAPYKFFGCRGSAISWLSQRAAELPHHKLASRPIDIWELGSPAPGQFAMISAIVDYVCWLGNRFTRSTDRRTLFASGMRGIELHERALLSHLLDGSPKVLGLRRIDGVKVLFDSADLSKRDLIVAIALRNLDPPDAVREYEKHGVIVYERVQSSLYSKRMLSAFDLSGAVRVSPLHCHSLADIDRFLEITAQIARRL